ncbi:hypothetical protein CPT_Moabite_312 [Serratia phage Moabite]|uniref:Uncharacterized protein n=2 Tax=Moabitevirus moabite TaxID=2846181 RepID=A0A7T3TM20_9CAUD|nr:hypothetical protein HWC48_gp104 [Serratia phage Moabite]QDB71342.1 hypothetical protein CPT_Moabite_312 [Serratia phage Moabite]QPX76842.1 hypothetical protein [Serratia phage vB_SmaM_Yaphecito]UGO54194.1 hypothetical protein HAYMO_212 [Serratia phage vB_SmaM_Haymo]
MVLITLLMLMFVFAECKNPILRFIANIVFKMCYWIGMTYIVIVGTFLKLLTFIYASIFGRRNSSA